MSIQVKVERSEDGALTVVKTAAGETAVARLHREARMLAVAANPGVVEVLGLEDLTAEATPGTADGRSGGEPRAALRLAHVGVHTLATLSTRDQAHGCGLVAAVAETVADLHLMGIVHGRVDQSHVLIDVDGRPILTGFAEAALIGTESDPGNGKAGAVRPADDLPGLGLLLQMVIGGRTEPDPIPDRRFARRPRNRAYNTRAFLNLADQATAQDPSLRPSARSLASAIHMIEPESALIPPGELRTGSSTIDSPVVSVNGSAGDRGLETTLRRVHRSSGLDGRPNRGDAPSTSSEPEEGSQSAPGNLGEMPATRVTPRQLARRDGTSAASGRAQATAPATRDRPGLALGDRFGNRTRRGLPAAAAIAGLAAITFGLLSSWHGERPNLAEASTPPDARSTRGSSTPSIPGCAEVAVADPSKAAGPCARSSALSDGTLRADGKLYAIGERDDEVLVGDWACTGTAVVALVRPRTGEVFVFTGWAEAGTDLTATALSTYGPGTHLETGPTEAGPAERSQACLPLLARSADGATHAVDVPRAAPQ